MMRALATENRQNRGLTGQGQPGLHTLLGGTGTESDASTYRIAGGAGQTSSVAQLARAYNDTRLAAAVSGTTTPATSSGGGGSSPGSPSGSSGSVNDRIRAR